METGDRLQVDLDTGQVVNLATGATARGAAADPFLIDMLAAGGLIDLAAARPELFA